MATYIRGICELYLDAPPSAWDSFFNGSASAPVDAFCGGGAKAGATLFVWSATDVKEVMREVVTSREVMVEVDDEGAEDGASSPGFASEEKKAEEGGAERRSRMVLDAGEGVLRSSQLRTHTVAKEH